MDIIDLPVLAATGSLKDAITEMRERGRRGVVVRFDDEECRFLRNIDVLLAFVGGAKRLLDIRPGQYIASLEPSHDALRIVREGRHTDQHALEHILDRVRSPLGIAVKDILAPSVVEFVTRHESIARELRSSEPLCVCGRKHIEKSPPASDQAPCLDCDSTYTCA